MIYVVKGKAFSFDGHSLVRAAVLSPEELEELLGEGMYDVAATPEAAAVIKETFGVEIPRVFQGQPPVKQGDKVLLLGPEGQVVDITIIW
jgi:hypothetical protein